MTGSDIPPDPPRGDELEDDPTLGAFVDSLRSAGNTDELAHEAEMVDRMAAALAGSSAARPRRARKPRFVRGAAIAAAMVVAAGSAAAAATGTNPFRPVLGNVDDAPPQTTIVVRGTVATTDGSHGGVGSSTPVVQPVGAGPAGTAQANPHLTVTTTSTSGSSTNAAVPVVPKEAPDPAECTNRGDEVSGAAKDESAGADHGAAVSSAAADAGCAGSNRSTETGPSGKTTGAAAGKGASASNETPPRGSGATGQGEGKAEPHASEPGAKPEPNSTSKSGPKS